MATENDIETRLGKRIHDSYAEEAGGEYSRKYKAMKEAVAQYEEDEKTLRENCHAADKALQDVMRKKKGAMQAFDEENAGLHLSTFYAITAKKAETGESMVRWVWKSDDAAFVVDSVLKMMQQASIGFDVNSVRPGDANDKCKRDLCGTTALQDIIHGFLEFLNMRIYSISIATTRCDYIRYELFKSASEMSAVLCKLFAAFPAETARRHFSISVHTDDTLGSYSSKFVRDLIEERDIDAIVAELLEGLD